MCGKFLKFLLVLSVLSNLIHSQDLFVKYISESLRQNFSLLRDFTCAVARDVLDNNPDMRTIGIVELKNKFPKGFSREIFQCLPKDVAKILLMPHLHDFKNNTVKLPKQSMIIYVADKVKLINVRYGCFLIFRAKLNKNLIL